MTGTFSSLRGCEHSLQHDEIGDIEMADGSPVFLRLLQNIS
jgi:hypothetical protein